MIRKIAAGGAQIFKILICKIAWKAQISGSTTINWHCSTFKVSRTRLGRVLNWHRFLSNVDWHYGSLARSVPKPLKVPSLARSVPKPLKMPTVRTVNSRRHLRVDPALFAGHFICRQRTVKQSTRRFWYLSKYQKTPHISIFFTKSPE